MKLAPFIQVDDDLFSISPTQLLSKRGKPMQSCRNGIGLNEIDYGDSIFRFQDSGRLEEVTKQASVIQLPNAAVPFAFLKGFILKQDPPVSRSPASSSALSSGSRLRRTLRTGSLPWPSTASAPGVPFRNSTGTCGRLS